MKKVFFKMNFIFLKFTELNLILESCEFNETLQSNNICDKTNQDNIKFSSITNERLKKEQIHFQKNFKKINEENFTSQNSIDYEDLVKIMENSADKKDKCSKINQEIFKNKITEDYESNQLNISNINIISEKNNFNLNNFEPKTFNNIENLGVLKKQNNLNGKKENPKKNEVIYSNENNSTKLLNSSDQILQSLLNQKNAIQAELDHYKNFSDTNFEYNRNNSNVINNNSNGLTINEKNNLVGNNFKNKSFPDNYMNNNFNIQENNFLQNHYPKNYFNQYPYTQNHYPQNYFPQNYFPQNYFPHNCFPQNYFPHNCFQQNYYPQEIHYPQNNTLVENYYKNQINEGYNYDSVKFPGADNFLQKNQPNSVEICTNHNFTLTALQEKINNLEVKLEKIMAEKSDNKNENILRTSNIYNNPQYKTFINQKKNQDLVEDINNKDNKKINFIEDNKKILNTENKISQIKPQKIIQENLNISKNEENKNKIIIPSDNINDVEFDNLLKNKNKLPECQNPFQKSKYYKQDENFPNIQIPQKDLIEKDIFEEDNNIKINVKNISDDEFDAILKNPNNLKNKNLKEKNTKIPLNNFNKPENKKNSSNLGNIKTDFFSHNNKDHFHEISVNPKLKKFMAGLEDEYNKHEEEDIDLENILEEKNLKKNNVFPKHNFTYNNSNKNNNSFNNINILPGKIIDSNDKKNINLNLSLNKENLKSKKRTHNQISNIIDIENKSNFPVGGQYLLDKRMKKNDNGQILLFQNKKQNSLIKFPIIKKNNFLDNKNIFPNNNKIENKDNLLPNNLNNFGNISEISLIEKDSKSKFIIHNTKSDVFLSPIHKKLYTFKSISTCIIPCDNCQINSLKKFTDTNYIDFPDNNLNCFFCGNTKFISIDNIKEVFISYFKHKKTAELEKKYLFYTNKINNTTIINEENTSCNISTREIINSEIFEKEKKKLEKTIEKIIEYDLNWFKLQFTLTCWKYYLLYRLSTDESYFSFENILNRLYVNFLHVYESGKRSFLTKVYDKDYSINQHIILLIYNIIKVNETSYLIEFTDGHRFVYSSIPIENPIFNLVKNSKIKSGLKLKIAMSKIEKVEEDKIYIILFYNSLSIAEYYEKLGIAKQQFLMKNLINIREDGGHISLIDIVILKKYNFYYLNSNNKIKYSSIKFEKMQEEKYNKIPSQREEAEIYLSDSEIYNKENNQNFIKDKLSKQNLDILNRSDNFPMKKNFKINKIQENIENNPQQNNFNSIVNENNNFLYCFKVYCVDTTAYYSFLNKSDPEKSEKMYKFDKNQDGSEDDITLNKSNQVKKNTKEDFDNRINETRYQNKLNKLCSIDIIAKNYNIFENLTEGNRYHFSFLNMKNNFSKQNKFLRLKANQNLNFTEIQPKLSKINTNHKGTLENLCKSLKYEKSEGDISEVLKENNFLYDEFQNKEYLCSGVFIDMILNGKDNYLILRNMYKNILLIKIHDENFFDLVGLKINDKNKIKKTVCLKNINFKIVYYFNKKISQINDIKIASMEIDKVIIELETSFYTEFKIESRINKKYTDMLKENPELENSEFMDNLKNFVKGINLN